MNLCNELINHFIGLRLRYPLQKEIVNLCFRHLIAHIVGVSAIQ